MHKKIYNNLNALFVIFLFVWISIFPSPFQGRYMGALNIFLFLAFLDLWARKRNSIIKFRDCGLWTFILALCLNMLFAAKKETIVPFVLNISLPLVCIYYMASEDFYDDETFLWFARTICAFSILVSLIGLFEVIFGFNPVYERVIKNPFYSSSMKGFVRPISTQWHPKVLASYLLYSFPFNFMLLKIDRALFRKMAFIGTILSAVIIMLSFSRCAFLGLIAMIAFYMIEEGRYILVRYFMSFLFLASFIASFFPAPLNYYSLDYLFANSSTSIFSVSNLSRIFMVFDSLRLNLFFGHGLGSRTVFTDNTYTMILSEAGIIGLSIFLLFTGYLLFSGIKTLKKLDHASLKRYFLICVSMGFIGVLIDISGYDVMYWPNPYLYFCILAGWISGLCNYADTKR